MKKDELSLGQNLIMLLVTIALLCSLLFLAIRHKGISEQEKKSRRTKENFAPSISDEGLESIEFGTNK